MDPYKKKMTFMIHATIDDELYQILDNGLKRVCMACVDDVVVNHEPSASALLKVLTGRNAMIVMAFNSYNIKIAAERTALTNETFSTKNIIAACASDKQCVHNSTIVLKERLPREDAERYTTKIDKFMEVRRTRRIR